MCRRTAALHVTRYYDQSRSAKQGAFIDAVASISQFITENSTFYTRNDNDVLEVVCDIGFCPFATVDGKALMSHDKNFTTTGSIHGQNFYTMSVTIPNKGFHSIQSTKTGMYSYYVLGQAANATYGYMGAINSRAAANDNGWPNHSQHFNSQYSFTTYRTRDDYLYACLIECNCECNHTTDSAATCPEHDHESTTCQEYDCRSTNTETHSY
ncbi:unnamed protein product [Heligmosomoides polygyrus]|uniref:Astacin domain-containing protein n=1 Tax=Heligmosomoides polygyrus TaxID=6339 RepID=A0A183G4I9_HELPZ|nr:unnamed protein product [Heligmosomoides polygyrus]